MIGLDSNVLVRDVMQDDAKQSPKATRLIESLTPESPGFVPLVTLVEFVWVLTASYNLTREQVAAAIDALLRSKELVLDRSAAVAQTLRNFRQGCADFADSLIKRATAEAGCDRTMIFDIPASKRAGMSLIT